MTLEEYKQLEPDDTLQFSDQVPISMIKKFAGDEASRETILTVISQLKYGECFAGLTLKSESGRSFTCAFHKWFNKVDKTNNA